MIKKFKYIFSKILNISIPRTLVCISFWSVILSVDASASPILDSLSNRGSFTVKADQSYDGPGSSSLSFISAFSDGNLYQMDTVTESSKGTNYSAFLISELAAYDGNEIPGYSNQFGAVDSKGNFTSIINTDKKNPIATGNFSAEAGSKFDFALKSPEGLFYSKDSKNVNDNGAAHMIAVKVTKNGELNLPGSLSLLNNGKPISFQLFAGDMVLFFEDMLTMGNTASGLIPFASDFDYNDMVVVLRGAEVPEPSTLFLLGSAAIGMILRRKKNTLA